MVHDPETGGDESPRLATPFPAARPVDGRRPTDGPAKEMAEGAEALEADLEANVGDAHVRFTQQLSRSIDTLSCQILVRSNKVLSAELPDEVKLRLVRFTRQTFDRERLVKTKVDEPHRAFGWGYCGSIFFHWWKGSSIRVGGQSNDKQRSGSTATPESHQSLRGLRGRRNRPDRVQRWSRSTTHRTEP